MSRCLSCGDAPFLCTAPECDKGRARHSTLNHGPYGHQHFWRVEDLCKHLRRKEK